MKKIYIFILVVLFAVSLKAFAMQNPWIECGDDIAGVVIDRFGKDVRIIKNDKKKFVVSEEVQVSSLFYAWMFGNVWW